MTMIKTDNLELRTISSETDAEFILELMNTPDFYKYIADRGVRTVEDARAYIELKYSEVEGNPLYRNHVIIYEGQKIGTCGIFKREGLDRPDIGFALLPNYYGKGLAYEASMAMLKNFYKKGSEVMVQAITTKDNYSSQKLLKRLGFAEAGVVKLPNDPLELLLLTIDLRTIFD